MSITQKVFSSRALNIDADTYVGEAGRLFYAQTTGTGIAPVLKYSDGFTAGGLPLSGSSLTFSSDTPPNNPHDGLLWWDTTDGRLYIYYDNTWVDASPDIQGSVTEIIAGPGISINTSTGAVTITAIGGTGSVLTATNYTVTTNDYWIGCSANNLTITLPQTTSQGRQYIVVDTVQSGNPGNTIVAAGGTTVVGGSVTQQGQSKMCVFHSGVWYCN